MQTYTVFITKSVQKLLNNLPDKIASQLEKTMLSLENNPRPMGYKKLKGREAYRIRQGNYRIIYEIRDNILTVTIINAGHRKEIYK
jgi:mRNA interferase RelE/StbE